MPIVGSFAGASARAYGLGAGGVPIVGDFESIQTIIAGSAVASIEFTSIPATYTHLQIRGIAKNTVDTRNTNMTFNSDTAANYTQHDLAGNGASASSAGFSSTNYIFVGTQIVTANTFSVFVIDILDYANTNKFKTVRTLSGVDANGSGNIALISGVWRNSAAITSAKIVPQLNNLAQYSSFALYGVKA
jgi:hypothetical protein